MPVKSWQRKGLRCQLICELFLSSLLSFSLSRFADERFDDRIMESSFAQQQFEEARR